MRRSITIGTFLLSMTVFAQPSPLQQRVAVGKEDGLFDWKAWERQTGAPVRSTPLVTARMILAGNAAGVFFAVDKVTGEMKWKFETHSAIQSSATHARGRVFFANNKQELYALEENSGRLLWKFPFGKKLDYPWRFDYFYSSPVIVGERLIIGGDDGFVHLINQKDGQEVWKFDAKAIVRSTVAVDGNIAFFGNVDGKLYAVDMATGSQRWIFSTLGDSLRSEDFGYDRKAILSSPIIYKGRVYFGSRDGFVYCVDRQGKLQWKFDHQISWAISTPAIDRDLLVTGTSDGHFVQAIDVNTGTERWRYRGPTLFWSSPLIVGDQVYIGGFDGQMYCLDLQTGERLTQFWTGGTILSSAVYDGGEIYFGSDDGNIYSLKARREGIRTDNSAQPHYVFYEPGVNIYYKDGADLRVKNYLVAMGYRAIGSDTLIAILENREAERAVIVFASDYFPAKTINGGSRSPLRRFLDAGGRIVLSGINPLVYRLDTIRRSPIAFNVPAADTVLGLRYGANDTRSFGGILTSFPNELGKKVGLPPYWVSMLFIEPAQVDVVLGTNENGLASSFIKRYGNGGSLVQAYIDPQTPKHLDALIRLADWDFK